MEYEVVKTIEPRPSYRIWHDSVLMCDCGDNEQHATEICTLLNDAWELSLIRACLATAERERDEARAKLKGIEDRTVAHVRETMFGKE